MDIHEIGAQTYVLQSGVNIGVIVDGHRALLIDTGLDRDTAKKILAALWQLQVDLVAIIVTHAHADHFGGAAHLVKQTGAAVYAAAMEAAVIRAPLLEPIYLFSGAQPPHEMQHKFLLAPACPVAACLSPGPQEIAGFSLEVVALPGHSPEQIGVSVGHTLFAGDTFFVPDILDKHTIPFYVNIDRALASMEQVAARHAQTVVTGHGTVITGQSDLQEALAANRERLAAIQAGVLDLLAGGQPWPEDELLAGVFGRFGMEIATLTQYVLARTTVLAALSSLNTAGTVHPAFVANTVNWQRV
jgi:glyoxylase-like metal-dependent hydrolase (beta-lactamase superfamily II)